MDLKLFRHHLAKNQGLRESARGKELAQHIINLAKNHTTIEDQVDAIHDVISSLYEITTIGNTTRRQLEDNLEDLATALKNRDHRDADILVDTIAAVLVRV